jgi:hypothetical protein
MKARLVNEEMHFEKSDNSLDSLNIGNPKIRKIIGALDKINEIVNNRFNVKELNFDDLISDIEKLRDINDIIIMNYLGEKFNNLKLESSNQSIVNNIGQRAVACYNVDEFKIEIGIIYSKTYYTRLYKNNTCIDVTNGYSNLKSLGVKLMALATKYDFSLQK